MAHGCHWANQTIGCDHNAICERLSIGVNFFIFLTQCFLIQCSVIIRVDEHLYPGLVLLENKDLRRTLHQCTKLTIIANVTIKNKHCTSCFVKCRS